MKQIPGTALEAARCIGEMARKRRLNMTDTNKHQKPPAPTISGEPEKELERKLKQNPNDPGAKVDVGSDESMDASDPSAAAQPGEDDEPVPSSGFPE